VLKTIDWLRDMLAKKDREQCVVYHVRNRVFSVFGLNTF